MRKVLYGLFLTTLGLGGCALSVNTALGPAVAHARAQHAPILIYAMGVPGQVLVPHSNRTAVPVYVQFLVTSDQPIARIRFMLLAYSQRGHPVRNQFGSRLAMILTGPGVFEPGKLYEVNSFHSQIRGFPGGSVACVELRRMTIIYVNGASREITVPHLDITLIPPLRHRCIDLGPSVDDMFTGG